jgi:hypothetical protein
VTRRTPSRRALAALAVVGVAALGVAACSGSEGQSSATTTTSTTSEDLTYTAFSDPSQVITVEVGRRFAIMLPADPAHGWRWVVEPVDSRYLIPLGSEFRDDPALLARSTTTTTAPPPPEQTTTTVAFTGRPTTTTVATTTTEGPTTTTTAPGPLVQIVSYAGRSPGVARITMRYERIGTAQQAGQEAQKLVFDVVVGPITPPSIPALPPG